MKLIGCHIDNFGAFHDYTLSFNDGLNVIMQANGWGKTTLAAFVKAMLYGFGRKRVRNVAENERLRYMPWQGGKYGGSLDFEANGVEYRVLRTFGATGARDTVRVVRIDTGKSALSETGEDIGEWLFGLDANAFQKSVYVVQNGFGFDGSTAGLRNRLNSLVNEADDVAGFDKAQAKLEERRKYYRRTGNRGAIADVSRDIAKLVDEDAREEARIAELRRIEEEIAGYTASIASLDERIADTQALVERDQASAHQEQALLKVGKQLQERQRETKSAYERATSSVAGKIPTSEEIAKARQSIAELNRLEQEAAVAEESASKVADERATIARKYPNGMPSRRELRDMRDRVTSIAAQDAAIAASAPETDEEFERLQSAVAADPTLTRRASESLEGLGEAAATIAAGKAAGNELKTARVQWGERKKRLNLLVDESEEKAAAVPADAQEQSETLRRDAHDLRSAAADVVRLESRCEALGAQLSDERAKLDAIPGGREDFATCVEALDAAAETMESAAKEANDARAELNSKSGKLSEAKRVVDDAQEKVDKQRDAAAQAKPGSPAPGLACLAIAVVAIVVGVVMGPAATASIGLYAVGAVLAVAGALLLSKRNKNAPAEPGPEVFREADVAKEEYERANEEAEQARTRVSAAEEGVRKATDELVGVVGGLFPGEVFDSASISAQVPVLKQRLQARDEQEKRVAEVEGSLGSATTELDGARQRAEAIVANHEEIPGDSYEQKATAMEMRASELASLQREADSAHESLIAAIAEEMGVEGDAIGEEDVQSFLTLIQQEEPPEAQELAQKEKDAEEQTSAYVKELNELLSAFGLAEIGVEELAVGAERLSKALSSYREGQARARAAERKASDQADALAASKAGVASWATSMGASGIEALTDEWFAEAEADISADEKAAWEEKRARRKSETKQSSLASVRTEIDSFFSTHGAGAPANPSAALDDLFRRADEIADLKKAADMAEAELAHWLSENQEAVASATARVKSPQAQADAARQLQILRQQRDALVSDRAQRTEQRSAILESLENRLAVQQELELLSKKKQVATSNLFTIQKTSEYLQRAREGLDGRYLGDLANRFGDYANAWLEGEEIDAVVDSEFGVALYDGDAAHDVAGYSTGYQDLLDICFRMALVDTVFQAEPPFLIMDDPFASLDEEKIRRAFLLLKTLSSRYQVIYFTCHPSRMEAGVATEGGTSFVLPEQHARRELPRARAKREAEERARAQAELVASYVVAPVTGGRSAIAPKGRHSISSNLFNIEFEMDDSTGTRDNSFEVHFIDEKGRVLCDRQTVEVMGGRTVPEKVRFSLATRDDSGATYDMVIHENGREPAELAARIPYKADVSFATDDFGF